MYIGLTLSSAKLFFIIPQANAALGKEALKHRVYIIYICENKLRQQDDFNIPNKQDELKCPQYFSLGLLGGGRVRDFNWTVYIYSMLYQDVLVKGSRRDQKIKRS